MPKKWMHPHEQLTHGQHGPARNMTVLTYAWSKDAKENEPMDWVIPYGNGRVYTTLLGHLWKDGPDTAMRCVGFQTLLIRGCEWAATGKVTYPLPKAFPTPTEIRLAKSQPDFGITTDDTGWTSLFNGKTLDGWVVKCRPEYRDKIGHWKVVDGTITAETAPGGKHNYMWLMTTKEYGDFELKLKIQTYGTSTGNSGIQVRSRYDDHASWLDGPQVDIHPPGSWRSGFIYDKPERRESGSGPTWAAQRMQSQVMLPRAGNGSTPTSRTCGTMSTSVARARRSSRSSTG